MNQKKLDNWLNKKLEPYKKKYGDNYIQIYTDGNMPTSDLVDIKMIFEEDALNLSIGDVPKDEVLNEESKIVKQSQDLNEKHSDLPIVTSADVLKPPPRRTYNVPNESVDSVMDSYHHSDGLTANNPHKREQLIEELKRTIREEMQGNKEENA